MRKTKIVKDLDPTLKRIAKEAADECSILTSQMEEAYYISMDIFMREVRRGSPVQIPNFGNFVTSPYKTERLIERMFASARKYLAGGCVEGGKCMSPENVRERLKIYWPIHERARKHAPRTGKRYRAAQKREQVLRADGDTDKLQSLLERREAKRPPTLRVLSERAGHIQSKGADPEQKGGEDVAMGN